MSIIVQRKHIVAPEHRQEFERVSAAGLWPTFLSFGSKMVAYGTWGFGGGPTDGVITHTAYENLEHWQATRQRFAGETGAFYRDDAIMAETAEFREISAGRQRFVTGSEARIIEVSNSLVELGVFYRKPGTSPAELPATFGRGSVVSERTYQLSEGGESEFVRLSSSHIWPWLQQQGARMIAYGHDPLGRSDEVITLFAFRSLPDWHRLSRPAEELASDEVAQAWLHRATLIRRHHGRLLIVGTDFGAPA